MSCPCTQPPGKPTPLTREQQELIDALAAAPEPETCVSGATFERHFHGECACGEPGFEELLPTTKDKETPDE